MVSPCLAYLYIIVILNFVMLTMIKKICNYFVVITVIEN